jgi:hypothetical protein
MPRDILFHFFELCHDNESIPLVWRELHRQVADPDPMSKSMGDSFAPRQRVGIDRIL